MRLTLECGDVIEVDDHHSVGYPFDDIERCTTHGDVLVVRAEDDGCFDELGTRICRRGCPHDPTDYDAMNDDVRMGL